MEDLETPTSKIGESAQRILDRALEEARRLDQPLTTEHVFLALAQIEWDLFATIMRDLGLSPQVILHEVEEQVGRLRAATAHGQRVAQLSMKFVLQSALRHATRVGRPAIQAADLISAISEAQGGVIAILRRHGVEPDRLVTQLSMRVDQEQVREERLQKRFELPSFLRHFATNLNLLARQDRLPPVHGRDHEMQQMMEILSHRHRANSVMLVGEPGVGKTAIVEGLAQRIEFAPETVPVRLRACQIVNLQMNTMVAGTMLRGMFEDRIQNVIRELKERPNLILFIDEAHTMIGAGSALGAPSDAANIFKSAMARGEVRIIGATTLSEYKAHVQEDEALARRFRTVHVPEPTLEETRWILHHVRPHLERNYSVRVTDDAIETALDLAPRYVRHLHLPDKPVGWLDTAAVRAEIGRCSQVSGADVMGVIADAAGIPVDMVRRDVTDRFRTIEEQLAARVVGQRQAVRAVGRRLILNKGPLKDGFDRPDGVMLFVGPTGVGKTELAKAVAAFLFGDEKKMIRLDMSEYQDGAIAADKLIGMPRGIVGSERGGVLTNQLRDNPYSVVLLDEVEKASFSLLNLFLQPFDEGWLTDGRGKRVYLSDAVVIMTSNLGSEHFRQLTNPLGFQRSDVGLEQIRAEILRELERRFPPEFRNRIDDVVLFAPLAKADVREIARHYLDRIGVTLARAGKRLEIQPAALERIVELGSSPMYGARFLKRVIDDHVKVPISALWHEGTMFQVTVRDDGDVIVDIQSGPPFVTEGRAELR